MIVFPPLTRISHIEEGTLLLLNGYVGSGENPIQLYAIEMIKKTESDGTEIILSIENNSFFNLELYLEGKSWVKDAYLVIKDNGL